MKLGKKFGFLSKERPLEYCSSFTIAGYESKLEKELKMQINDDKL